MTLVRRRVTGLVGMYAWRITTADELQKAHSLRINIIGDQPRPVESFRMDEDRQDLTAATVILNVNPPIL